MRAAAVGWVALLLAVPALAAPQEGPIFLQGRTLVIDEGNVFVLTGNASIRGPGAVLVHGTLVVQGDPLAPGLIDAPIRFLGPGDHLLADVRLQGANGTAVTLDAGRLTMRNVTVSGVDVGVQASGDAALVAERLQLMRLDRGIDLRQAAAASLSNVTATAVAHAIASASSAPFRLEGGVLRGGAPLDLAPDADGWQGAVLRTSLAGAESGPALRVRGANASRLVLEDVLLQRSAVGLEASGGLAVEGGNDTFLDNGLGLSVRGARVHLRNAVFGNNTRDFDGPVTLEDATFLAAPRAAPAPPGDAAGLPWGLVAATAGLALGGALVAAFLARERLRAPHAVLHARLLSRELLAAARDRVLATLEGASARTDADVADRAGLSRSLTLGVLEGLVEDGLVARLDDAHGPRYRMALPPPAPDAPPPDLATPLRPQERRLVEDLLAHPGSAQSAVAQRLGVSRQALHYHVKKLEGRGLLTKVTKGRETLCYVRPEAEALLAHADVAPPGDAQPP